MNNTIMLAPLRPLISPRTWNLLVRNGYTSVTDVRFAQTTGALRDVRNLGPVGLLEIRLALDNLSEVIEPQSAHRSATPDYSLREAVQDMQSACSLYLETGDLDQFRHALKTSQLAKILEGAPGAAQDLEETSSYPGELPQEALHAGDRVHLHAEGELPATSATITIGPSLTPDHVPGPTRELRPEPEPVDDDFTGYDMSEPGPGYWEEGDY